MLTVATTARVFGEVLRAGVNNAWLRWLVAVAGLFQIAAMGLFFYTMWSRIRALGSRAREANGERF